MAISEIYVDPSIAGDSGTGALLDPFGDLEYAIEQTTFDTTNGTRVNIKAGTDEVLAAKLETALADTGTTAAWSPSETAPLIIQGYSSVAGDLLGTGTTAGISGGGLVGIFQDGTRDYTHLINLHMHNTGANSIAALDEQCSIIQCEAYNTTGNGVAVDNQGLITECYVHSTGAINRTGIKADVGSEISYNYVDMDEWSSGIWGGGATSTINNNIIVISGTGASAKQAINSTEASVINNSIYSSVAYTGAGIRVATNDFCQAVVNNLIEGISGAGGVGIDFGTNTSIVRFGGNAVYNCTTAYDAPTEYVVYDLGDNETLTESPFTDAANGDFSPVDTGNVIEGALPNIIGGGLV